MRKAKLQRKLAPLAMDLMQDERLGPAQAMQVMQQKAQAGAQMPRPMQPFSQTKNTKPTKKRKQK